MRLTPAPRIAQITRIRAGVPGLCFFNYEKNESHETMQESVGGA